MSEPPLPPHGDYRHGQCLHHGITIGRCCSLWEQPKRRPFLEAAERRSFPGKTHVADEPSFPPPPPGPMPDADGLYQRAQRRDTPLMRKLADLTDEEWSELAHRMEKHLVRAFKDKGYELVKVDESA